MTKQLPFLILGFFVALMALMFVPAPAATVDAARDYFTDQEIERGRQFGFERRFFLWGDTFMQLGLLLWLVFGNGGRRVTALARKLARGWWLPTVLLVGAFCFLILSVADLPWSIGRWAHLTAWGMTSRSLGDWFGEHLLTLGVAAATEAIPLVGLYLLLRWFPRWWWLPAALGASVLAVVFAWLMPIVVTPLFNTFTPLAETEWAAWEAPLRRIAEEGKVPVEDVYVIDASRQGHHSNAYFIGFGGTRRIVLYDNLLKKHTLPEVESILAHELGHWLHDHIVQGLALGSLGLLLGFYVLARILRWAQGSLGLEAPSDPAGLPLILLAGVIGSWLTAPVQAVVSRHFERQADWVALELGRQPEAFIAAEVKLTRDNIMNPAPAPWNVFLYASHPPPVERIEMAERWRALPR